MATEVSPTLLSVEHMTVRYGGPDGPKAVDDVTFHVAPRERVAIVGESGSGKSTLGLAAVGFLTVPGVHISAERLEFKGRPIRTSMRRRMPERIPGVAMVFQDAMTSLDPVWTVGAQLGDALRSTKGGSRKAVQAESDNWLRRVGLDDTERIRKLRPYELSGGMRQRVMLAIALSGDPQLVIADEPTSALDASVSRATMDLLDSLVDEMGLALVIVSHDIELCSQYTDRTLIMYRGRVVDQGQSRGLAETVTHPYAKGLLACVPDLDSRDLDRLPTLANFFQPELSEAVAVK